ncbi:MAG: PKD domain-containing protein, partial [Maribacter sp.]
HECSFVQAGDKFFLMGGRENAQTIDVYDYTSDSWVNLTASAPKEFNHFQATEYQGLIWIIGAFGDNAFPTETPEEFIWAFDPSNNEWIQGPQIPAARRRGSTGLVVQNNKFYIVGGNTDGHDGGYVPWFDEYDPATGVWTPLTDAPRARDHFSATVVGNNLYLAGGRLSGGAGGVFAPTIPEVDVYNFGTGAWSTLPVAQNIPTPRGGASTANFNGKLVVIGGEVQNQVVYGTNTTGALDITEEYDPNTQSWTRIADLNSPRHGTQAIVSGSGIFILAGSNALGGGNQKNMEYLGIDNPVGAPSTTSSLSAPASVLIADGTTEAITVDVINGNVGVMVTSMVISGPNAADFSIANGELTNQLLNANASHTVSVALAGAVPNRNAILTINYSNGESTAINLTNFDSSLNVTNPGTQNNNEGDTVALQIQANGASTYSATGLPPTLVIDPNTGLISGTISAGGANDGPFLEQAGLVVMEAESGTVVPTWAQTTTGGATGIIAGSNHLSIQNGGTIPYQITVGTPGVYRFNWRSFFSGTINTEENDNWLRFPNDNGVWFFGFQGTPVNEASLIANVTSATPTNIVFPKGSPRVTAATTPEGNGSNGYFKIFRSGGTSEVYDWQALTSDNDSHDIYVYFENAGTFTMEISERSLGHAIDKMALYKVDNTTPTNAQLTAAAESTRANGGGAADGSPYTVTVSVSDNGAPPSNTNTQFIWNVGQAGDPIAIATADPTSGFAPLEVDFTGSTSTDDVGIVSYLWNFDDGSPTSSIADPTHTFTAIGTYNVQLTVEDVDTNTSTTNVIITVTDPAGAGTIRINSGGPTYTFNGVDWNLDQHFIGGAPFENAVAIANTANDQLYQTERFNSTGTLTYEIPVVAGNYHVNLHFAELFFGLPGLGSAGGVGSRVFDINVENGQVQIDDYDIFVAAGGAGTAIIEDFSDIVVNDGNLTITLTGVVENPKLSGIEVIIPGGDSAPEVYAGEDQIVTLPSAALDGSATDPDGGGIASFAWTQESGPNNAIFSSTTTDNTVVSNLVQGIYVFRLTATDEEGDTGFDDVTITIEGAPGSLLINSGGPAFTFGTEDWTADQHFVGGAAFPTVPNPIPIANTTNDELYQTERFDASGTLVYEIPVVAGDYNVDLHFAELFFGQPGLGVNGGAGSRVFNIAVENETLISNYDIFVEAGGSATAIIQNFKAVTVTDGSLTITLTGVVENPKVSGIGVYDTAPPVADAGMDQAINLPTNSITLNGSGTDPDGGAIVTYQWSQESGPGTATLTNETTADLTASDLIAGDYVFRLTVTDDETETGFDEVTVTVVPEGGNQAPVAVAEATPLNGTAPLEVTFTGSNSTDDVAITSYTWDFGDGTSLSAEADPVHIYQTVGVYTATLTVEDAEGLTNTATITITVLEENSGEPLMAVAESDVSEGNAPLIVTFTGSNSIGDNIVSYSWNFGDGTDFSTDENPQHIYTIPGTYEAVLTISDGEDTSSSSVTITVTEGDKMSIILEQNPANVADGVARVLVINMSDEVDVLFVTLHDVGGRLMSSHLPADITTAPATYEIPISNLRTGLYLVRVVMSEGDSTLLKLMVNN